MNENNQDIRAEAREIMLKQMRLLLEQSERAVKANEGVPAMNLSAMSREMANIGRVLCGNDWRPKHE